MEKIAKIYSIAYIAGGEILSFFGIYYVLGTFWFVVYILFKVAFLLFGLYLYEKYFYLKPKKMADTAKLFFVASLLPLISFYLLTNPEAILGRTNKRKYDKQGQD